PVLTISLRTFTLPGRCIRLLNQEIVADLCPAMRHFFPAPSPAAPRPPAPPPSRPVHRETALASAAPTHLLLSAPSHSAQPIPPRAGDTEAAGATAYPAPHPHPTGAAATADQIH